MKNRPRRTWSLALRGGLAPLVVGVAAGLFAGLGAPLETFAAGEADQSGLPEAPPQAIVEAAAVFVSAQIQTDAAEQAKLLGKAQTTLESFLKENPTHKDAALAQLQLGIVLLTTGKIDFANSKQAKAEAARRALAEARAEAEVGRARDTSAAIAISALKASVAATPIRPRTANARHPSGEVMTSARPEPTAMIMAGKKR